MSASTVTGTTSIFTETIMGLPFSLHIARDRAPAGAVATAVRHVWQSLRAADRTFSPFRPDSAISRRGRAEPCSAAEHHDMGLVLEYAERARVITGGSFDVRYAGRLDPCGIVKGWAAERAATFLDPLGVAYYLNAGGDIVLRACAERPAWRIGIEHPDDPSGLLGVLELPSTSIATSGSAHRGEHIIDPRTGCPATGFVQVTVVGPSLTTADVAATALMVTGTINPAMREWLRGYEILAVTGRAEVVATRGIFDLMLTDLPARQIL